MKFIKSLILSLVLVFALSTIGCTYTANGSVIQDVTFNVSYENLEGENVDIDATLSLYKTFTPKTYDHILKLIKNGFYNDTQIVFDEMGKYLILGAYDMQDDKYIDKITTQTVKGEFTKNGHESELKADAGALVLLREPDSGKGEKKFDSGKAVFAIMLESSTDGISNMLYAVFGRIGEEELEDLKEMRDELYQDADGFVRMRYVGDRDTDETSANYDKRIVENGAYVNSYEFYLNTNDTTYFDINRQLLDYGTSDDEDYKDQALYNKLTDAYTYDLNALPIKPIVAKNFKLK